MLTYLFYTGIVFGSLHLLYIAFANTRWDEEAVGVLHQRELHLAHLLELWSAPDIQAMSANRSDRQSLFARMSQFLLADVLRLLKSRSCGLWTLFWGGLFLCGYGLVKAKALLGWGRNDLNFLAGLELAVVRSLPKEI